jgi:TonB-linked SusC/RagA family outer membrane protein
MDFKALWGLPVPERAAFTKTMRVMKLTAMLLFVGFMQVSAASHAQTITLSAKNESLIDVFEEIRHQAGYEFLCNVFVLQKAAPVTAEFKNTPVEEVLAKIFRDQPLTYSILNGKTIVVKAKEMPPTVVSPPVEADTAHHPSATVDLIGVVQNERGQPLADATVAVKGKEKGTVTNEKGHFKLSGVSVGSELVISFVGYTTGHLKVAAVPPMLTVTLNIAVNGLDQAVVQAYGTTSQRLTTGNITQVSGEEIEKQPVMNPLLALEGRVAGLDITPATGYASGAIKAEIRGRSTINPGFTSDPLYIIDGVPLTVLELGNGTTSYQNGSSGFLQSGAFSAFGTQSPLFSLNPSDIESITVLKDADATAIYGSRGANGVIIITTKRGKAGKTKFDLNLAQGASEVTRHWDMLNTTQYLEMRRKAFKNDGITPTAANAPDLLLWDTTRSVNWQQQLWGGMGKVTNVQASLSGGDDRTVFRIGAAYSRQTEILTSSGANQRASLSFNLTHHSQDRKFLVSLTTNYSYALVNTIAAPSAVTLPPDAPPIYNSARGLNFAPWDAAGIGYDFPFGQLLVPYSSQTNFLTSNLTLSYELVKGLVFRAALGYNNTQDNTSYLETIASQDPANNPTGLASFGNNSNNNWNIDPQLEYTRFLGAGKLDILVGGSEQATVTEGTSLLGFGYTNDAFMRSIGSAPQTEDAENYGQNKYAAAFGRINYTWANKYTLNLNARRDGSSRFGPGDQFGNFGSVGAAWIASEERWFKQALPGYVSFVKVRSSYGITGSDNVGLYQYLSQWGNSIPYGSPLYTYDGISALINQHAVDQDYHWATTKKLEAALDLGFFKDKLFLEVVYYQNRTDDQLLQYPTAVFTGFSNVTANWPANVQNNGWEFTLNAQLIHTAKFSWSVNGNMSINRNMLLSYPGLASSPYVSQYKVGQSLNNVYLLHYTGLDPLNGQYSFEDYAHLGVANIGYGVSPGTMDDDRRVAVNLSPAFFGGLGSQLKYKDFGLNFFLHFKKQMAQNAYFGNNSIPGQMANQSIDIFNSHWQKPGDKASFAKFTTQAPIGDQDVQMSDRAYTDASFIRLSNVYLTYALPAAKARKAGMQGCNLFIKTENIFVLTRYKGIDPEIQNFGAMPPARIFTGGLSFNF